MSINHAALDDVERYAQEVADLCHRVRETAEDHTSVHGNPYCAFDDGALNATLKRRTMDLTRALAALRRS